jgi:predicted  nucleic acid-binding Zn-ribbon protein
MSSSGPTNSSNRASQQAVDGSDASESHAGECNIVAVGKRRNGGMRYWCLHHRADATAKYGARAETCRAAHIPPIEDADILSLRLEDYPGGVALWGAVPPVYDTTLYPLDRGVHVHARKQADGAKEIDRTFRAVRLLGEQLQDAGILMSELDAIYYMVSSVFKCQMKYVVCSYCGYPHLDRDWFSVHPHHRHLCAGCGRLFDDIRVAVGNPICGVRDVCDPKAREQRPSDKVLEIRQAAYPGGIQIWGSNPAFVWTSPKTETEGIHVHAYLDGDEQPVLDETYSQVTIDGVSLDPFMVRMTMAQSALPHLKERVVTVDCPSCGDALLSTGELAFTPVPRHQCIQCGHEFTAPGRLRKTIDNPIGRILQHLAAEAPRQPRQHDLGLLPETL